MKKIVALLLLSFSVQAGVTLDWEINLLNKVNNYYEDVVYYSVDISWFYTLNNGDLFTGSMYGAGGSSIQKIVILDKDNGNIKYAFDTSNSVEGLHFHNDGSFSYSELDSNWSPIKYHIHFLNQNGNYEHTEVTSFIASVSGAPILNQSSSDIVYLRANYDSSSSRIIRKYTITSDNPTPTLSAQTSLRI